LNLHSYALSVNRNNSSSKLVILHSICLAISSIGTSFSGTSFSYPLKSLSFLPSSLFDFATSRSVISIAMLFSIFPATFILPAIRPVESTLTFFFIICIISFVFSTIRPRECTVTFHFIIDP